MHPDQLSVTTATVRALVHAQFPQWESLPVRRLNTSGTVNAIFRLGGELAVRLPLRRGDPAAVGTWLRDEAAAMAELAEVCPVPTPRPVALGEPGGDYPLPWLVQTWLPGVDATITDPADSTAFAHDLADLIASLRAADVRGRRFSGSGRGGHLPDSDEWVEHCLRESQGLIDVVSLRAMWEHLRALPEVDQDVMSHGDLTPPNVLVRDGRLAGVLDGGGFAAADPALDLVGAWHLLDARRREIVRERLGCSDVQWQRGMAWAFQQAIGLIWYYAESNPTMSAWGSRTLHRLLLARTG